MFVFGKLNLANKLNNSESTYIVIYNSYHVNLKIEQEINYSRYQVSKMRQWDHHQSHHLINW